MIMRKRSVLIMMFEGRGRFQYWISMSTSQCIDRAHIYWTVCWKKNYCKIISTSNRSVHVQEAECLMFGQKSGQPHLFRMTRLDQGAKVRWPGWITALVRKWKQCRAAKRHVNAKRLRFRDALFALVSPLFAFVKSWRGQSIKVFVRRSETLWIEENHASSFVFNTLSTMNETQS